MRTLILGLACASLLVGCGRPDLIGNDRGGIIDWHATNEREVFTMAEEHCGKFNRRSKITSLDARAGGKVIFSCDV